MAWPSDSYYTDKGYTYDRTIGELGAFVKIKPNGRIIVPTPVSASSITIEIAEPNGARTFISTGLRTNSDINHHAELFIGYLLNAAENTLNRC